MARIRTIKPELPQDEAVGKLSREARLCWLMCFTLADDEGRFRAHPALVASSCFPYDALPPEVVDGWLEEASQNGLLLRYVAEGQDYAEIPNWRKHQLIDRPSPSRLPAVSAGTPREPSSRTRRVGSEGSAEDKELEQDQEGKHIVPNGTHSAVASREVALRVFDAWKAATGRNGRTVFTDTRQRLIARWLRVYPVETLTAAALGVAWDPHNMGDNDRGKKYDSLELIFRDAEHIERFSGYELDPSTRPSGHPRGRVERELRGREMDPRVLGKAFGMPS